MSETQMQPITHEQMATIVKILRVVDPVCVYVTSGHACGNMVEIQVDDDRNFKIYPNGEFYANMCEWRNKTGCSFVYAADKNEIPPTWVRGERPDYHACILDKDGDHARGLCGRSITLEWHFTGLKHWLDNRRNEGRLVACKQCLDVIANAVLVEQEIE